MKTFDIHTHHKWLEPDERPTEAIQLLRGQAEANNIVKVLLLGNVGMIPANPSVEDIRKCNTGTLKMMAEDREFFHGACYLNPSHDHGFLREELARCVEGGMCAVKQWIAVNARDKRMDYVMQLAMERDLPVMFHAWYKTVHTTVRADVKHSNESNGADVADLAKRFPASRIVLLHLPGVRYRGVRDVEDLPNVCMDTSGGQPASGLVEYAVRHLGEDRVLYASDYESRNMSTQLGRIYGADISEQAKKKLLWDNAVRVLKIEDHSVCR